MQMLEHPLAVLDLAPAETAAVGPVQAGRMAFETHAFQLGLTGMPERGDHSVKRMTMTTTISVA